MATVTVDIFSATTPYNQTGKTTDPVSLFTYGTNVSSTTLNSESSSSDDRIWQLVNILGLLVFVAVVIGPIAYVTFCCKRSPSSPNNRCQECRNFWTYCCPRCCRCTETPDVESGHTPGVHFPRVEREIDDSEWRPPDYDDALTMVRVEDTIEGTPPPIYKELFKGKPPIASIITESNSPWHAYYSNRGFEDDDDGLSICTSIALGLGGYSSFNSYASCRTLTSMREPRCSYTVTHDAVTTSVDAIEGPSTGVPGVTRTIQSDNTNDNRSTRAQEESNPSSEGEPTGTTNISDTSNNEQPSQSTDTSIQITGQSAENEPGSALTDAEEVRTLLRVRSRRWRDRERPLMRRAGLIRRSTSTAAGGNTRSFHLRRSRKTTSSQMEECESEILPSYEEALVILQNKNEEVKSSDTPSLEIDVTLDDSILGPSESSDNTGM